MDGQIHIKYHLLRMMDYISPAKVKFISWVLVPYLSCSSTRSQAQVFCCRQISIRLPQRESKRVLISSFKLSVSTMFLSLLMACLTFSVFFLSSSWRPGTMPEVYAMVYSAYLVSCFLSQSRLRVICDLYSLEFMANFQLRVRMSSEERMIPDMAAMKLMSRPTQVVGTIQPQPTVPMVMMTSQRQFQNTCRSGLFSQASIIIRDIMWDRLRERTTKQKTGDALKTDLMPKSAQFLALQILHMRLALGVQQIDALTRELQRRQMRRSMRISKKLLRWQGIDTWLTGYCRYSRVSLVRRLGWKRRIMISRQVLLRQSQYLLSLFSFISCFFFSFTPLKYLMCTSTSMRQVSTECSESIKWVS